MSHQRRYVIMKNENLLHHHSSFSHPQPFNSCIRPCMNGNSNISTIFCSGVETLLYPIRISDWIRQYKILSQFNFKGVLI